MKTDMNEWAVDTVNHAPSRGAYRLPPEVRSRGILGWFAGKYNSLHRKISPPRLVASQSDELTEIRQLALTLSDIDEHLERIFAEALLCHPKLIVELGVRGGVSTFVLER